MEFEFTVKYKKGAKNTIADAISRFRTYGEAKPSAVTEVPCYIIGHYEQEDFQEPPTDVGGEGVVVCTAESRHGLEEDEEVSSLALEIGLVCTHTIEVEDFFHERFDEIDCEDITDEAMAVETAEVTGPLTPLTTEELLEEQKEDEFCQEARARLANNSEYQYFGDHYGLIRRQSQKDSAKQIILPKTLRRQALLLAHYPRLAGHPGGSCIY